MGYLWYIAAALVLAVAFSMSALDADTQNARAAAQSRLPRAAYMAEKNVAAYLTSQIQAGASTDGSFGSLPSMPATAVCPAGTEQTCSLVATATYATEGGTSVSSGAETAPNVQREPHVNESLLAVKIQTVVSTANGVQLATSSERATYRLTKVPGAEVALVGSVASTGATTALADGGRSGCDATNGTLCDSNGASIGTNYDTSIKSQLRCETAGCFATPVPQDARTNLTLTNGNVSGNGWRP